MRASLIIFGVIFLVIGVLFYLVPNQEIQANTTTGASGEDTVVTSSARVSVPEAWAIAFAIIGLVLFFLGLVIPSRKTVIRDSDRRDRDRVERVDRVDKTDVRRADNDNNTYEKIVEEEEYDSDNGKRRKVVKTRTERRRDDDDF
jgi:hypothetical protein